MSVVVASQANYGDMRVKDVYNRHLYSVAAAPDALTPLAVNSNFYGITAADSANAIGINTQFELVKMSAVESAADSTAARLDISINDGTNATAAVKVAELSATNAKFVASTLSGDFGSSYTTSLTKGTAHDPAAPLTTTTIPSTDMTFTTGAAGTDVKLAATSNNLLVTAASTELSGEITLQGDRLNFYQKDGVDVKKSAANMEYMYTHNAGTAGTSTGVVNFNLDPQNVLNNQMASGAYNFNSFNAAGTAENVLSIGAGAATGTQEVRFSNASVGVGIAPTNGFKLDVVGDSRVDGNITVTGDLIVSGTTTTIDTATLNVEDKNVNVAYNVTDRTLIDGAGVDAGTGANQVQFRYSNNLTAWDANVGLNVPQTSIYSIAGGYNTTLNTGVTLSKDGLFFGSDTAVVQLGTAATIDAAGLAAATDDFAVTFGAQKTWRITMIDVSGTDFLAMQYSTDNGTSWTTKFSVGP